ncbi:MULTISPECIES: XTP/dITP diphosphatase [unclassified Fictibacillus]|uniref:XTP/dITP diphosphatase n=1 Tax=unclassified Fictibacillus TaxID=2644029 RepID=UPI0006A7C181|nr:MULTISPECIES: XTP/dITP diphosphatase [unclassified Fictibacillus]MED2972974.1 XTP/dITP diphosphatase [Fictibacillus sp. B-59209]SFD60890.1 XTP/dITP diphosphohydrolase [Bacillus sp. OV194]
MKKVLIATKNEGKVKEFTFMFSEMGLEVTSLLDVENTPDVEETGTTFAENAALKAEEISELYNIPVIADDSGLVIDALDGRPGVFSARYAGIEKDDNKNMDKVLDEMRSVPPEERSARFVCALAVASPGRETLIVEGHCEGEIGYKKTGSNGFGYDPIFVVGHTSSTMAELTKEEKNKISHRANAMAKLKDQMHLLF